MPNRTPRTITRSLCIGCLGLGLSFAASSATENTTQSVERGFEKIIKPVFAESCIKCHGLDGKEKGDLNLLEIGSAGELINDPERLEEIIDVLDFEDMPAKRCLLDIDAARRAAEAASLGGRNQVAKLAQLDHRVNGSSGGAANSVQPPPSAL